MSQVHFPEQNDFKYLLIKSHDISNIRPDDPDYLHFICNLDIYEEKSTSSKDFFYNITESLKIADFEKRDKPFSLNTQVIGEFKGYIYELIHLDLLPNDLPTEIYNGVGNVLKNDMLHIFGNVIMIKTQVQEDKNFVEMVDCSRKDLYNLLESRIRHLGVKIDDDGETEEFNWYYEDPSKFIYEFMVQDHKFIETSFLLHNLQIYYTPGEKDDMERLIGEKYDQMIIMTKKTDYYYGDFTMSEFKDIIKLLKSDCPLECPEEWKEPDEELKKKLETEKRKFIFNKYRALWKAKDKYLK